MDYAHSRGVLHRDLKPGNIMLGKYGETLVVDWGLAKVLAATATDRGTEEAAAHLQDGEQAAGANSSLTRLGDVLGTLAYMGPEQAEGKIDTVGPAWDIYGLAPLCTPCSPAEAPHLGESASQVVGDWRGDFPRPRVVNPASPRPWKPSA